MKSALIILSFCILSQIACVSKVKVDIFYESLCPDSIRFIADQLRPNYPELKQHLQINFIPFGKSSSFLNEETGQVEFKCQHGPEECFGNKVQGCVLSKLTDQDSQVNYVACQMRPGAPRDHQQCVVEAGFAWEEIYECTQSDFATQQQQHFEQVSSPIIATTNWVPSIIYNDQFKAELANTSKSPPFKTIICDTIYNTNPACKLRFGVLSEDLAFIILVNSCVFYLLFSCLFDINKVQIGVHYESRCPDSRNFVQDELKKVYPSIKDQVEITYYPLGKSSSYINEDGTVGFECQHGKPECDRNMLQNCALNLIGKANQDLQTSYIICAMDFGKDQSKCIEDAGLNVADAMACFHGPKGIELQLQTEKDSGPIIQKSRFVPTIVYNGEYNREDFYDSLDDFAKVVRKVARQLNE
ncbi:unnamed protein product [Diamesa tonsa]